MSLQGIAQSLQAVVTAINSFAQKVGTIFPLATSAISHTATGGADTLPANPAGFLTVTVNGTAYKVPIYNP